MRKFRVHINEGSFFDQWHIEDVDAGKHYEVGTDYVPAPVMLGLIQELKAKGRCTAVEARVVFDYAEYCARPKPAA